MGSTSNALDKGGQNFKEIYYSSDVTNRNRNYQTKSGLYSYLYLWSGIMKDIWIKYGMPVFDTPKKESTRY